MAYYPGTIDQYGRRWERCNQCGDSDNPNHAHRAIYPDGGSWCFRCSSYQDTSIADLLELWLELPAVVGTEEQLSAAGEDNAQVGLGAATVAAVSGRQRARGGQNSSHVASSLARRAVVPGSTSNQAENVPARGFSSKWLSEEGGCCQVAAGRAVLL